MEIQRGHLLVWLECHMALDQQNHLYVTLEDEGESQREWTC